jgi:imidazolonepropionase-like amidohydrolase
MSPATARPGSRPPNTSASEPPARDLQLDTLVGVLKGRIKVQNHCYRADQMAQMIDISKEFGYHVTSFHHAVEAYKVADLLKENDVCATVWTNWGGFKMEGYDAIEENAAMLQKAGTCITLHSDDQNVIQRLNQEAAEAVSAGRRAGIDIPERVAIQWITKNPAKILGILDQTGTLEPGKRADVVIWNRDPFSVYALTQKVFVDGGLAYDRHDPTFQPKSDFMLGQPGEGTR